MELNDMLRFVPAVSLLVYAPILCYLDIRYRDIKSHRIWAPLIILNGIVALALLGLGVYAWWFYVLSLVGIVYISIAWYLKVFQGADFVYLVLIFLFLPVNPISGNLMFLTFMIFLIVWMGCVAWYVYLKNVANHIRSHKFGKEPLIDPMIYPGGIPMMIPVSLALLCAVVFG